MGVGRGGGGGGWRGVCVCVGGGGGGLEGDSWNGGDGEQRRILQHVHRGFFPPSAFF